MIKQKILSVIFGLLCFLLLGVSNLFSQNNIISGTVFGSESNQPLAGVNVYLNETTIGDATDKNGDFRLSNIPNGTYKVVFSFVGYKSFASQMSFPRDKESNFRIELEPDRFELGEIVVTDDRKEWLKNYERFKKEFLGFTKNARMIEITNPEELSFDNASGPFIAKTEKPLIILNNALGYKIKYYLNKFVVDNDLLSISGYSQFLEIKNDSNKITEQWKQERKRAYKGSFRHFIRNLVNGDYHTEGFRIYYSNSRRKVLPTRDSYYKEVESVDKIFQLGSKLGQIILYNPKSVPYLRVEYLLEKPEKKLAKRKGIASNYHQVSWIEFPNDKAVIDILTGNIISPNNLILHGYWGWSSRLPEMLPKDYK